MAQRSEDEEGRQACTRGPRGQGRGLLLWFTSHHVCLRRAGKVHVVLRERNVMRCETAMGNRLWSACVRYETKGSGLCDSDYGTRLNGREAFAQRSSQNQTASKRVYLSMHVEPLYIIRLSSYR